MKTQEAVSAPKDYESAALTADLQARSWQYVTLKRFLRAAKPRCGSAEQPKRAGAANKDKEKRLETSGSRMVRQAALRGGLSRIARSATPG